ncbi:MAG: electron transfer flavoprotein subunit beta/FixA family protein [Dehalococcoidales bacterium]|nr:electron transfer flavoprotein subunit beta/FixA family protein [Dehalococcoidales bacterium]
MDIAVCLKQVPHPDYLSKVVLDPVTKRLHREGIPLVINPVDRNAIEAGIRLKERFSGKVTAVTMGPPEAQEALEEALAMGADTAILLCDRGFAGADTYATAYTLAMALTKSGKYDLILCGNETIDSGTSQVGPQIAEFLDIPHVTNVKALDFNTEGLLLAERSLEDGYMKVQARLPVLVTVNKEINKPRIPSVIGIMQVAGKTLKKYGLAELGLSVEQVGLSGSPTQTIEITETGQKHGGSVLQGEPAQVVKTVVSRLRELQAL